MCQDPLLIAALHRLPSMTPTTLRLIITSPSLPTDPLRWTKVDLETAGLQTNRARAVLRDLPNLDPLSSGERLDSLSARLIHVAQPEYPRLLKEISSPPPVLYVRGRLDSLSRPTLAVVGTRRPTPYGRAVTPTLIEPAARAGLTIVSGLARGIDALAHAAALATRQPTLAVLGCGIDRIYPIEHEPLAEAIVAGGGAILTEFPIGAEPARHHFPQRNRIIAGLAQATLLIEAGEKSGALITAKFAVDANRDVLAVPGPITSPASIGPNNWIMLGAAVVRSAADILEVYHLAMNLSSAEAPGPKFDRPEHRSVYEILNASPQHIDELAEKSRLDPSVVSAALALLDLQGAVRHVGGQFYTRA